MTSDRRKAVLFLIITFIVGIFIGTLIPSLYGRMRGKEWKQNGRMEQRGERGGKRTDRRMGFERKIFSIVKPDSVQKQKIRVILDETGMKIEALEKGSSERMMGIMDSMKLALKPVLSEEQMKNFEEFSQKARARRKENK